VAVEITDADVLAGAGSGAGFALEAESPESDESAPEA
jgi:hypothetical protein